MFQLTGSFRPMYEDGFGISIIIKDTFSLVSH